MPQEALQHQSQYTWAPKVCNTIAKTSNICLNGHWFTYFRGTAQAELRSSLGPIPSSVSQKVQVPNTSGPPSPKPFRVWLLAPKPKIWVLGPSGCQSSHLLPGPFNVVPSWVWYGTQVVISSMEPQKGMRRKVTVCHSLGLRAKSSMTSCSTIHNLIWKLK